MKEKAKPRGQPVHKAIRISGAVAILVLFGLALYLLQRPEQGPPTANTSAQLGPVVSPETFENFIGPVTDVGADSIAVRLVIIRPSGTHLQRDYEVKIDRTTDLSIFLDKASGPELQPATLADFRRGDRVGVYGQENLSTLTSFTAAKIYKIVSS